MLLLHFGEYACDQQVQTAPATLIKAAIGFRCCISYFQIYKFCNMCLIRKEMGKNVKGRADHTFSPRPQQSSIYHVS